MCLCCERCACVCVCQCDDDGGVLVTLHTHTHKQATTHSAMRTRRAHSRELRKREKKYRVYARRCHRRIMHGVIFFRSSQRRARGVSSGYGGKKNANAVQRTYEYSQTINCSA